jgi:hypothetical protein
MTYTAEGPKWSQPTVRWSFTSDNGGSAGTKSSVEQAFGEWSRASGLTFIEVADAAAPAIRIGYANLDPASTGEIGYCSYTYSGGAMVSATIRLQDPAAIPLDADGVYTGWSASFHQLALHEIGHAIGLGHDSSAAAAMNGVSTAANRTLARSDTAGVRAIYQDLWTDAGPAVTPNPGLAHGLVGQVDNVTGAAGTITTDVSDGSVGWISSRYFAPADHGVAIAALTPFAFIATGSGNDAIQVTSGDNVLYAGSGSNFLTGGSGTDTFFMDARDDSTTWSTLVNFHQSDMLTLWGFIPGVSKTWWDPTPAGADGYAGATMRISTNGDGAISSSVTFADMSVARAQSLQITSGVQAAGTFMMVRNIG